MLCYLCLYGAVLSPLSLMQEVVGSSLIQKMYHELTEFSESHFGKTLMSQQCETHISPSCSISFSLQAGGGERFS